MEVGLPGTRSGVYKLALTGRKPEIDVFPSHLKFGASSMAVPNTLGYYLPLLLHFPYQPADFPLPPRSGHSNIPAQGAHDIKKGNRTPMSRPSLLKFGATSLSSPNDLNTLTHGVFMIYCLQQRLQAMNDSADPTNKPTKPRGGVQPKKQAPKGKLTVKKLSPHSSREKHSRRLESLVD